MSKSWSGGRAKSTHPGRKLTSGPRGGEHVKPGKRKKLVEAKAAENECTLAELNKILGVPERDPR
jgi:hypothetical protein